MNSAISFHHRQRQTSANLRPARMRRALLGGAFALAFAAPAWAEPATQAGADQMKAALQHYFGKTAFDKGMITLVPNGEGYKLTLAVDSARLDLPADAPVFRIDPNSMQVTAKDDGTYALTQEKADTVIFVSVKNPASGGPFDMTERLKACSGQAVFDPKLMAFTTQDFSCEGAELVMHTPTEDANAQIGRIHVSGEGKPGANGNPDVAIAVDMTDFMETVTLKPPLAMPATVIRADKISEHATVHGYNTIGLAEVLAFVARTDLSKASGQQGLKSALKATLPLWQDISRDTEIENLSIGTPRGIIKIASLGGAFVGTGIVKEGRIAGEFKLSGLEVPEGMRPDWLKDLLPSNFTLDLKVTQLDLEALANLTLDKLDLSKSPFFDPSLKQALLQALVASTPYLDVGSSVTAPSFDIKESGGTTLVPTQQGKATVSASGLDAVREAIDKAPTDSALAQRLRLGLIFLKGLAKTGPDGRATYDIEFDSGTRKLIVNGQPFGSGK